MKFTTKERPILFKGEMVREILSGKKTQTRRIMKVQPPGEGYITSRLCDSTFSEDRKNIGRLHWIKMHESELRVVYSGDSYFTCPYGQIGDRLWVRETFYPVYPKDPDYNDGLPIEYDYKATYNFGRMSDALGIKKRWESSIHMPRRASRITLEIVNIRIERLNDISAEDARKEGVKVLPNWAADFAAIYGSKKLFESINGAGSWELNPWVWVIEFRRIDGDL